MQIRLRALGFELTAALQDYVRRRLGSALDRHEDQVRRVEVVLSDENGPRGGMDKRCMVRLVAAGLPAVHVLDRQQDLYAAIDRALGRAAHALARRKGRRVRNEHGRGGHGLSSPVVEG